MEPMERLKIEKLVAGGYSLARRSDGKVVFLQEGYPGETVIASFVKGKQDFQIMKVSHLISPSEHRRERLCENFPKCGGCDWQDLEYFHQLYWKGEIVKEQFRRVGKMELSQLVVVPSQQRVNYRNKMEFVSYPGKEGLSLGLYARGSLTPVDCDGCVLGLKGFDETRRTFQEILRKTPLRPYDRNGGSGELKHLVLRGNGNQTMAILITKGENLPGEAYIVENIQKRLKNVKTLVHLINTSDKVVLRGVARVLYGDGVLSHQLSWQRFEIPPTAFYQNNSGVTEAIIDHLERELGMTDEDSLLDLYAGVGTFSLTLGRKLRRVVAVESSPVSAKAFRANAKINGMFATQSVESDVVDYLKKQLDSFTTVVMDPPRSGVGRDIILVEKFKPSKVAYISCDPTTLARDISLLKSSGFEIVSVKAFDMFPQTWHVETVVVLSSSKS